MRLIPLIFTGVGITTLIVVIAIRGYKLGYDSGYSEASSNFRSALMVQRAEQYKERDAQIAKALEPYRQTLSECTHQTAYQKKLNRLRRELYKTNRIKND